MFLDEIIGGDWPKPANAKIYRLKASLHGSLAYTGIGHATDRAVILGLCGYRPDTIDPDIMDAEVARVAAEKTVQPEGHPAYHFDPKTDLVMDRKTKEPATAIARKINDGARERGILMGTEGPFDNVLKMRPPMIFTRANADHLLSVLEDSFAAALK